MSKHKKSKKRGMALRLLQPRTLMSTVRKTVDVVSIVVVTPRPYAPASADDERKLRTRRIQTAANRALTSGM